MSRSQRAIRSLAALAVSIAVTGLVPSAVAASTTGETAHSTVSAEAVSSIHYPMILSEMKITTGYGYVPAGKVTFDITNVGATTHEVVFLRTDADPGSLAYRPTDPSRVVETGSIGEASDIAPGATTSITLDFAPGRYVLVCNEPEHYHAGMRVELIAATFLSVALTDPMSIGLSQTTVPAGPVVVEATNAGAIMHEVVFLKTDLAVDKIPLDATDATKADESLSVGEVGDVDAGRFSGNEVDLTPGHYVLICNEPGHYAAGMRAVLTVQ